MKSYVYAVYDLKEKEQYIGIFENVKEMAEYFNSTANSLSSILCKKRLYKKRYKIEKINDIEEEYYDEIKSESEKFNLILNAFMPDKVKFDIFKKPEYLEEIKITGEDEEWKEIKGFNYSISNYGMIRNNTSGKIKSLRRGLFGYQVNLWNKSKGKMFTISRTVANYFIREVKENERVRHIDGRIRNNYYKNLEIVNK